MQNTSYIHKDIITSKKDIKQNGICNGIYILFLIETMTTINSK